MVFVYFFLTYFTLYNRFIHFTTTDSDSLLSHVFIYI